MAQQPQRPANQLACQVCAKPFNTRSNLNIHLACKHQIGTIYPCRTCEKIFGSFGTRAVHEMRKHTGERPYICAHCTYSTADSTNLRRHHVNYHPEQPLPPLATALSQSIREQRKVAKGDPGAPFNPGSRAGEGPWQRAATADG